MSEASSDRRRAYYYQEVRAHGGRYADFDWPSVEVALNLLLVSDEFETYFAARMAAFGVSISAFNILNILTRRKAEGCFPHELSELLLVSRANTTGVIDTLAKQGLVVRDSHAGDRRKCVVRITRAGENLLKKILPSHFRELKRILSRLSAAEKKTFMRLMGKLREALRPEEEGK